MTGALTFTIPAEPVPFARAGSSGKRRFTPTKQANFMATVRLFASRAMAGRQPFEGAVELCITGVYQHPKSWPEKKKAATLWKTSAADLSNIVKLAEDALNGLTWRDDAQVASVSAMKIYGPAPALVVSIRSLEMPQANAA